MTDHEATPAPDPAARPPLAIRLLRGLRPSHLAWAIPGPVFAKEVWMAGRRASTYWIRGGFVLGMTALVALVFMAYRFDDFGTTSQRLQRLQQMAPNLTVTIIWFQYVAIILAAVILASPMICDEKRKGTLSTLLCTPLKAWQILLGKLSAMGVQLLVLALAATPLLLALRLFGGVTAETIAAAAWITISSAALASTLTLLGSVMFKRSPVAAASGLVMFLGSQFMVTLAVGIIATFKQSMSPALLVPMFVLTPPLMLGVLSADLVGGGGMPIPFKTEAWLIAGTYNWVLACLTFGLATVALRRAMRREGEAGAGPAPPKRRTKAAPPGAEVAAPPTTADAAPGVVTAARAPSTSLAHASRVVGDNPVLWREVRQRSFGKPLYAWVLFGGIGLIALWIYFQVTAQWRGGWPAGLDLDELGDEALNYPTMALGGVITMLLACFTSSQSVSSEKESRTWEVLLATPMTAREIVWGKFVGALRRQWIVPAIMLGHLVVVSFLGPVKVLAIPQVALVLFGGLAAITAVGVFASVLVGKSTRAAGANFGFWLSVWAAIPLLIALLIEASGGGMDTGDVISILMMPNPVAIVMCIISGSLDSAGSDRYDLMDLGRVGTLGMCGIVVAFATVYVLFAFAVLRAAAMVLASRSLRLR
ncbi:MAG: ABC transporter permease subunit [Phycisphaerales bacterium]|nr:ABC transporter permease subunit [Phycisphaerales bacterium]